MNHFKVVGFLIPSKTGKSYKVCATVNGKDLFIGLVSREALLKSLRSRPMEIIEICRYVDVPFPEKPTEQTTLKLVNGLDQITSETRVAVSDTKLWTRALATAVQQLSTADLRLGHVESEEARTVSLSLKEPFFYALGGL